MINEEKWLEYWEKNKIFEKSVIKRKGKKEFVFYEGPPYANGRPGIHHIETRSFKDIILRYKTMKGYFAPRIAGWDTHGLPTEMEVEKKLGIKSKREIEEVVGIEKFVEEARANVFLYKGEWEKMTHRIAYWLDFKNAYVTMENYYIENLWRIIKEISDKKLLYEDYKVLPWCTRCGTALSHHEVAQGYKNTIDTSVVVKFPIINSKIRECDSQICYVLAWTTTPWTLPGNVALAVCEDITYSLIKIKNLSENYILAKDRLSIIKEEYEILKEIKGKNLIGFEYKPLFEIAELKSEKSYKIYGADFVNTEDGTGVVHTAVMYGDDDYKLGKKIGLPFFHTVTPEGKFVSSLKNGLAGMYVKSKETEQKIITYLAQEKLLFSKENYTHDYPYCWRCQNPLLYYAKNSWFFKTTAVKQNMIHENNTINWRPEYLKKGRFGEWLKDVRDWAISRERYWGTPLPIWKCGECGNIEIIGSIKELKNKSALKLLPLNKKGDLDLHRPYIDEIKLKCLKCKAEANRVKEVADVWFDSGAMPIAKEFFLKNSLAKITNLIKKNSYPADYICEAIDQTRGWFYTLLAVSSLLGLKTPYKNVVSLGLVLDAKGQKMSKSRGNTVNPWEMIEKYGADSVRWYFYTINQPWDDKLFKEKDIENSKKGFINILLNSFAYFKTYAGDKFKITNSGGKPKLIINKWLIVKFNNLVKEVNNALDNYDIVSAARKIEGFVIEDISHWYIRRIRDIIKNEKSVEAKEIKAVFRKVLNDLTILIAPFTPFIAEEIYLGISPKKQSVHLEDYPVFVKNLAGKSEKSVLEGMELARRVASFALEERSKLGIKVRQPLATLKIRNSKLEIQKNKEFLELIKGEVNVKEIVFDKNLETEVWLDAEITPELKEEGILRDITRAVQDLRKKAGLTPSDTPSLLVSANNKGNEFLQKYGEKLIKETKFSKIEIKSEIKSNGNLTNLKIDDLELNFTI